MTVSTTSSKVILPGNGFLTSFGFTFQVRSASDLQVTYTDANGNQTVLGPTQYGVALNPIPTGQLWAAGGSVTYPLTGPAIASGTSLTIARNVAYLQNASLINQGGYYPQNTEAALDLLTMQDQQLAEQLSRAIVANLSDTAPQMQLPPAAVRAGGVLAFDTYGNVAIVNKTTGAPVFTTPAIQLVLNVAALRALVPGVGTLQAVDILGYITAGDGGAGRFWWNSADTTTDNGGTVIQPNAGGTGRWNKL